MDIPRHWRLKAQRYRLEGSVCLNCGQYIFPPRPICPHCNAPLVQIVGGAFPVILTPTGLTDIESHVRYQIMERMIK